MHSAYRRSRRDGGAGPRQPVIHLDSDELVFDPVGVMEPDSLLSEQLKPGRGDTPLRQPVTSD